MNTKDVLALLASNQDERGIAHWERRSAAAGGLASLGIGLTRLRKLAKQIGRDRALAVELWQSDVYDARVISLLIDDPKQITREQAERQVEQLAAGYLAHVFSTCGAALAKTPFTVELASDWVQSDDAMRRDCGYGLLYEISKWTKKSTPDDAFFLERVAHIDATIDDEDSPVQAAMGCALMGIGKRSPALNAAALRVARRIGPIHIGPDERNCEPFDVEKHLTSDYIRGKLGV